MIPAYNNAEYLDLALRSARAQSLRDTEIIVVDDGSTDSTGDIADRHAAEDTRLRVIRRPNGGVAAARNDGLGAARSPWVALLDADDIALPRRLERQLAFLASNPDVVALGTFGWRIGRRGRRLSQVTEGPIDRTQYAKLRAANDVIVLLTTSVVFSRDLALALGGFRRYVGGADDVDMWTRMADDHVVLTLPEALAEYRVHDSSTSTRRYFTQLDDVQRIWTNTARRRTGLPEFDEEAFRRWDRRMPTMKRALRASNRWSRYCYRRAGGLIVDRRPEGLVWLVAALLIDPAMAVGRLRRQLFRGRVDAAVEPPSGPTA